MKHIPQDVQVTDCLLNSNEGYPVVDVLHITVEVLSQHRIMVVDRMGRRRGLSLVHGVGPCFQRPHDVLHHLGDGVQLYRSS